MGGSPEQIAAVEDGEEADDPQVLGEGTALLFTIAKLSDGPNRWDRAEIVVQDLASGRRKTVVRGGSDPRYLPTGHLLYASRGVLFAVVFDPADQAVTGEPVPVVEGVMRPFGTFSGSVQAVVADNGTLVYVPGPVGSTSSERVLALADRSGAVTRLSAPPGPYDHIRASRDGARLAIGTDDGREAVVWIYDMKGNSAMRRLTFGGQNRYPIWSPDGRRVVFQSDSGGDRGLFAQNADGTGSVERLTTAEEGAEHIPDSWSPDGRYLLFSVRKDSRFVLFALSLRDSKTMPVGGIDSARPIGAVFSPDGRWIAYTYSPSEDRVESSSGVYVQPFPPTGSRYQVQKQPTSIDYHPVWSPDGSELVYVLSAGSGQLSAVGVRGRSALEFGNVVGIPARVTASRRSTQMRAHDILPDGRFVGLVDPSASESSVVGIEFRVVLNWFEELKARVPVN
jgi:hypothetical protein